MYLPDISIQKESDPQDPLLRSLLQPSRYTIGKELRQVPGLEDTGSVRLGGTSALLGDFGEVGSLSLSFSVGVTAQQGSVRPPSVHGTDHTKCSQETLSSQKKSWLWIFKKDF